MSTSKIEFAVQMTCISCEEAVKKSLENQPGIKNINIDLKTGSVLVETTLPTLSVQKMIEKSGRKVVVRGYAGSSAGVAILNTGTPNVQGVVRFAQVTPNSCIIDGTIDGLQSNAEYKLAVHECGDISQGCDSVGDIFNLTSAGDGRAYGDLGIIKSENNGRAAFRMEDSILQVPNVIGRSLIVSRNQKRIVCGIIARSAGVSENPKTICACDGVTIWNEKIEPKSSL